MTYLFKCEECGEEFEVSVPYTERENIKECALCKAPNPKRLYTSITSIWNCDGAFGKSK